MRNIIKYYEKEIERMYNVMHIAQINAKAYSQTEQCAIYEDIMIRLKHIKSGGKLIRGSAEYNDM